MVGRKALPELAKSTANEEDWKDMAPEEQERLIQQLRDFKSAQAEKKVVKVTQAFVGNDIEGTLARVNAEVSGIHLIALAPSDWHRFQACPSATAVTCSTLCHGVTQLTTLPLERSRPHRSKMPVLRCSNIHQRRFA